jgi:hypothetical protein
MAAAVTLSAEFFDDPSFDHLGVLLGIDPDLARMKVARLWSWQTEHYSEERPTYVIPEGFVIGKLGAKGPAAMIEAGLAERRDGGLFLRGTDKLTSTGDTRIGWLGSRRADKVAGGKARAAQAEKIGRVGGRFTSGAPAAHQHGAAGPAAHQQAPAGTSGTPAATTSSGQRPPAIRDQGSGSSSGSTRDPGVYASIAELVTLAYARMGAARESIEPGAPALPRLSERPLVDRLRATPPERRERDLVHCLDVLIAEAERDRSVNNLRMGYLGGDLAWPGLLSKTVASVRGRDGPGGDRSSRSSRQPTGAAAGADALEILRRRKQGQPP